MGALDKRALVAKLLEELDRTLGVMAKAARDAHAAATHEEARPENDKDTRGLEAAYLAGAQAERAREIERTAAALAALPLRAFKPGDPISASALVELDQDGARRFYFLAPQGGGLRVTFDGVEVQVVTPEAPLGRELLGKAEGDEVEVPVKGRLRAYEIVAVS